jgi:signal transduction histidine kinase
MQLLPQSLFGRLLLLLLLGLILAQSLSTAILLYDRGQVLYRAAGGNAAHRIAAIVRLLDEIPARERSRMVAALDIPPSRISLNIPWRDTVADESGQLPLLVALLRRQLPPDRPLHIEVEDAAAPELAPEPPPPGPPYRPGRYGQWENFKAVLIQVQLQDGTVVSFSHRLPDEVLEWPYRLLLILLVLLVSVGVLAALAVRGLTRPLALLAKAAVELGRDIHRPPLPERGPLEVRRAARAFNTMQARLSRYIQDRSRVLTAVSHDLKTPLTRLRLRAELLEEPKVREKFQADLDDMEAMVQATLEYMRGTEVREPLVAVDIDALLESLQEDAGTTGGEVGIRGKAQAPFQSRPLALKRCLTNLLDNALHYGKRALIRVEDGADCLRLVIADAGPGIPEAELEKVFEPFYRLEGSRSKNTGGTGLGLGIARNIARAHGGELTLRNGAQGGLEAVLELPR